jgi:hypothetical protein
MGQNLLDGEERESTSDLTVEGDRNRVGHHERQLVVVGAGAWSVVESISESCQTQVQVSLHCR